CDESTCDRTSTFAISFSFSYGSTPSMVRVPFVGFLNDATSDSIDVLPAPLRPMRPYIFPASISTVIFSKILSFLISRDTFSSFSLLFICITSFHFGYELTDLLIRQSKLARFIHHRLQILLLEILLSLANELLLCIRCNKHADTPLFVYYTLVHQLVDTFGHRQMVDFIELYNLIG